MIARKNRRHRDPGPMFPFGDIMLPVIGIVALGLLVVGIKMFFLPASPEKEYKPVPAPKVIEKQVQKDKKVPGETQLKEDPSAVREKPKILVAVPVSPSSETGLTRVEKSGSLSEDLSEKNVKTDADALSEPSVKQTGVSTKKDLSKPRQITTGKWNVQIGSFVEKKSAEVEVSRASRAGFSAQIMVATVKGKTYHRVYVPAGNERSDAVVLEKKLKAKGFPTFIAQY